MSDTHPSGSVNADELILISVDDHICEPATMFDAHVPEKYKELYNEIRTSGKVKPEDLTPELVVQYHQAIQREEKVVGVLAEVAPELQNELKVISELRDVWDKNPSFTVDDISDIAKDVYGNKAAKALSRKVKKAEPVKVAPEGTPAKDPRQEAVTFDDLE